MLSSLDAGARRRRWFSASTDIHQAVGWAADPTAHHGIGLVAVSAAGDIVGHGALIPLDDDRAEVCFEVAAPWRRHGIAGRLLDDLARRGAECGLRTLVAEVLPENDEMLAVLREHGQCVQHRHGNVLELSLAISPVDAP